jgi:proton-dependent oligopeptide transporter, POT family
MTTNQPLQKSKTIAGHPVGLFYLFATEFWERFSYYGMRALLVFYIVDQFFQTKTEDERTTLAYGILGAYGALVYSTPVLGGMIAQRFLGYKNAVVVGGISMAIGHLLMAVNSELMFYWALGFLIVGNGFFKPNISSILSSLYAEGDRNREKGFTIFYMGVNLGAFVAPIFCGWLYQAYGAHYGFALAGIGMILGLIIFVTGNKSGSLDRLNDTTGKPTVRSLSNNNTTLFVYLLSFLSIPVYSFLVYKNEYVVMNDIGVMEFILILFGTIVLAKIGFHMYQENKENAQKLFAIILITFIITVFWSFFEQAGSSLGKFAEKNVDLPWWCNEKQANSINPFFISIFAIPFVVMWTFLDRYKLNPNTIVKAFLGLVLLGIGFLVFAYSPHYVAENGKVPFLCLVLGYYILTMGELCISPISLSKVTELSPVKIVSFMLGGYYLSVTAAHVIGAQIAKLTVPTGVANEGMLASMAAKITGFEGGLAPEHSTEALQTLASFTTIFAQIGIVAIGVGVLVLILSPFIKRLMHEVH